MHLLFIKIISDLIWFYKEQIKVQVWFNLWQKKALLKINLNDFKKKKLEALLEMLHSVDRGWFFIYFAAIVSDCIIYGKGRKFSGDVMIFVRYELPPLKVS